MDLTLLDMSDSDYSALDSPEVLMRLFHPRPEYGSMEKTKDSFDVLIPVESDVVVAGRYYMTEKSAPNVLFFHGNGEIVADYDDLGPVYNRMGMNLLAVDYRGYGRSTGKPTVTNMMMDCHEVFKFTKGWLEGNGYIGIFIVMGRSLGSASALELASRHKGSMDGLIVESGFAYTGLLLAFLGVNSSAIDFREEKGFRNLEKIRPWDKPTLVIHAEFDHIIPFSEGQALYNACSSSDKDFLKIPGANHNDIFMRGLDPYMKAVRLLCERSGSKR